jgi:hypothetical protein
MYSLGEWGVKKIAGRSKQGKSSGIFPLPDGGDDGNFLQTSSYYCDPKPSREGSLSFLTT